MARNVSPPLSSHWVTRLEVLVLAAGIGLRLARFLDQRPLWLDESMLSMNFLTRSPFDFLLSLNSNQRSPWGFLLAEWVVTRFAGNGEHALRFVPMVAGVAALIVFARLSRRILEPGAALFATTLAALSPLLIYYSAEVKSYSFDLFFAALLMHATITIVEGATRPALIRWGLVAGFGALLSVAAPFFVAGSALALLAVPHVRKSPRTLMALGVACVSAALLFAGQVLTVYDTSSTSSSFGFWGDRFLGSAAAGAARQTALFAREFSGAVLVGDAVVDFLPRKTMTVLLAVSVIGAFSLGARSLLTALLVFLPTTLVGIASFAHYWPLTQRLMLFAVPAVIFTLAEGFSALARAVPRLPRMVVPMAASLAFVGVAIRYFPLRYGPDTQFVDFPTAIREVASRAGTKATVYISGDLVSVCRYYLGLHPDRATLPGLAAPECRLRNSPTVIGRFPPFMWVATGQATPAQMTKWLQAEERRILEPPAEEVWVVIGARQLQTALPKTLEAAGLRRFWQVEKSDYVVIGYRDSPSGQHVGAPSSGGPGSQ